MKKTSNLLRTAMTLVLVGIVVLMGTLTVLAADEPEVSPGGDEPIVEPIVETIAPEPDPEPEPQTTAPEPEPVETEADEVPTQEVIENIDPEPSYEAPEHLDELPTVNEIEIQIATAVDLPDIEVSETSLIGGVLAWLCVALGIAVIVGVMVSRRTRRRGA